MKNNRKQRIFFACIVIAVLAGFLIFRASREQREADETAASGVTEEAVTPAETEETAASGVTEEAVTSAGTEETAAEEAEEAVTEPAQEDSEAAESSADSVSHEEFPDDPPDLSWLTEIVFPDYTGEPYAVMNGGMPYFDTEEVTPVPYERYYPLDGLGRCTQADAVVGPETAASGQRGEIWMIKPAGWHSDRYASVDGEALYNRCHLIAHYLSDEDANERNLVTGTRYMNTLGMNASENMVGDYVKETGNHVRYRVTPVYQGDELLCRGLLVEAYSIEDKGEEICFCIYTYNVQPGFVIDYATGDNFSESGEEKLGAAGETRPSYEKYLTEEDVEETYVLNTKSKKFHLPECEGAQSISEQNRETYTGSRNALVEQGYKPCGSCNP